jgi:hypothetical protein
MTNSSLLPSEESAQWKEDRLYREYAALPILEKIEAIKSWGPPYATGSHSHAFGTKYCVSFGKSVDHFWLRVYQSIPLTSLSADFIPLVDGDVNGFIDVVEVARYSDH